MGATGVIGLVLNQFRDDPRVVAAPHPAPVPPPPPAVVAAPNPAVVPDFDKLGSRWALLWGGAAFIGGLTSFSSGMREIHNTCAQEKCSAVEREARLNKFELQNLLMSRAAYMIGGLGFAYFRYLDRHPEEAPGWLRQIAPTRPRPRQD